MDLSDATTVASERLLVATGRRADPAAAGLDTVGVPADARYAPIDDHCRVTDGVWAVGDITGKGGFTHVSMYQAEIVISGDASLLQPRRAGDEVGGSLR